MTHPSDDQRWNPDKVRQSIATNLRAIGLLCAALHAEVLSRADDPDIPGGDAMVMLGPSANPEAWSYRELAAALGYTDSHGDYEHEADPQPPLLVLATWEDAIRNERSEQATMRGEDGARHLTDLTATLERCIDYLARPSTLDWCFADDEEGDMNFIAVDDLDTDLRTVRGKMQALLKIGEHEDRGAPCLAHGGRYVKVWDEEGEEPTTYGYEWHCRGVEGVGRHKADPADYALANANTARRYADRLTGSDMELEYRVRFSKLRTWVARGKVHKRGKDQSGRWLYDVAETVLARDAEAIEIAAAAV